MSLIIKLTKFKKILIEFQNHKTFTQNLISDKKIIEKILIEKFDGKGALKTCQ